MAESRVQRRLAAILAADVVGYSRLAGLDEEGTLAAFKAHRRELTDPTVERRNGRIVKTTGDGVNIAARLEGLADAGGVLVSRAVRYQVRDRLELVFEDMGERELKNIVRPARAYRLQVAELKTTDAHSDLLPLPD